MSRPGTPQRGAKVHAPSAVGLNAAGRLLVVPSLPRQELIEDQDRVGGGHLRHALQPGQHQVAQGGGVAGPHQQHDVVLAGHQRGMVHLGNAQHLVAHLLPGLLRDLEEHVRRQAVAVLLRVDGRAVPGDHPGAFEPVDPGVGVGPGDVQLAGQRAHGKPAVGPQRGHDLTVQVVRHGHLSVRDGRRALMDSHTVQDSPARGQYVLDQRPYLYTWPPLGRGLATYLPGGVLVTTPSSIQDRVDAALPPSADPLALIDPDGHPTGTAVLDLPPDQVLRALHRQMVIGRRLDTQATALTRQGRLAVYPSSRGQEACQVGAVLALREQDWLFPTYRDTVAVLTRSVAPAEAL